MRNVVRSSINGFAGNFANKVGESLGMVKMPDGSDGKITVPKGVKTGSLLNIEGSNYIVLEEKGENKFLVMTEEHIDTEDTFFNINDHEYEWDHGFDEEHQTRPLDGLNASTYENGVADNYLENKWYNSLPSQMKKAIVPTDIIQTNYAPIDINEDYYTTYNNFKKVENGYNGQKYNTIRRHVFLPSLDEYKNILDVNNQSKVEECNKGWNYWLRDSLNVNGYSNLCVAIQHYAVSSFENSDTSMCARPTFVVDLSKVESSVVGTAYYK